MLDEGEPFSMARGRQALWRIDVHNGQKLQNCYLLSNFF